MERLEELKKDEEFKRIVSQLAEYLWKNKNLMQYGVTDYEKALLLGDYVLECALDICHSRFLVEVRRKKR